MTARVVTRPGWLSHWIEEDTPIEGAYEPGTRVRKIATEPKDTHPIGALATVVSAVQHPTLGIAYFVEWDAHPRMAVLVVAAKLGLAS